MRVVESCSEEFLIVPKELNNVAGLGIPVKGLDLVAEYPLVTSENSVLFILSECDLFLHVIKVDRFGTRSNAARRGASAAIGVLLTYESLQSPLLQDMERFGIFCVEVVVPNNQNRS